MQTRQQGRPIADLSVEDRALFRKCLDDLRERREAASIESVPARQVLEPHLDNVPDGVRSALLHLIQRDEQGPARGEPAPDFHLKLLGSEERVRLSGFRGQRPVALVFGSYT